MTAATARGAVGHGLVALEDVAVACRVIGRYMADGSLPEDVLADAVRMRLVEIGDAVRLLPASLTEGEPEIPWSRIGGLGARLVHCPRDGARALVLDTARTDVPGLLAAVERLLLTG